MTLGEICCFYPDQLCLIIENFAMSRENLKERGKGRHRSDNWLSVSGHLVTKAGHLTVSISQTVILNLIGLTEGPYILNCMAN